MNIVVLGAGAVGCYYAARLALAGQRVTLIARPAQLQVMQAQGLRLIMNGAVHTAWPALSAEVASAAQADVLLLCVKSRDTEAAAQALRVVLPAHAVVVSLQNGVENPGCLQQWLSQPIAAAAVYLASAMQSPGVVEHLGRGELLIGPITASEALQAPLRRLAELFRSAGVGVEVSPDVLGALWAKLVINCAYNALSAMVMKGYGELVAQPGILELQRRIVAEAVAVAQADGHPLDGQAVWAATERIAHTMPAQFSSTAQDLLHGRPTEIDHLNGTICRRGAALGVPTPVNQALWTLVKEMEREPVATTGGATVEVASTSGT